MNKYTILSILVVLTIMLVYPLALYGTEQEQDITIDEKWTKYHGNDAKYLVSDTDGNVYSMTDSWWFVSFDASNRYVSIDEGKTYTVTMIGWRVPILSWYQNIIEIEER